MTELPYLNLPRKLTKEEMQKYCQLASQGDKEAKEKLKIHNLRFVIYFINKKYGNTHYSLEELVSLGVIGLIKAVESYQIDKGTSFLNYAAVCIDNEIKMFFRKCKCRPKIVSFDNYIDDSNSKDQLRIYADLLADEVNMEEIFIDEELYQNIHEALNILSPKERLAIELYYGFGCNPKSQAEVGQAIKTSQSYASRLIKKAEQKIKNYLELLEKDNHNLSSKVLCKKK